MPNTNTTNTGLFSGIRVIEFGQYVAAPYAAEQFAHGGAEVLCIEPIAGTPTRLNSMPAGGDGKQFVVKARGKRSVALALGTEEGRAAARKLCLGADVVISNMRPGSAAKMGLDYESLRAEKPSLIYGEVDGFGAGGSWAGRACVDLVAQGFGGLMTSVAATPDLEFDRQQLFCDYTAGTLLAFGVASALFHRERTGRGQHVATSLVAAALVLQHRTASIFLDHEPDKIELVDDRHSGADFDEIFQRRQQSAGKMPSTYGVFRTLDGWIAMGAIPTHFGNVGTVLGIEGTPPLGALPADQVNAAIAARPTAELVDALVELGCPLHP
ncbi:MAG: CoA transferase [Acidimicrobiales bacterium]